MHGMQTPLYRPYPAAEPPVALTGLVGADSYFGGPTAKTLEAGASFIYAGAGACTCASPPAALVSFVGVFRPNVPADRALLTIPPPPPLGAEGV